MRGEQSFALGLKHPGSRDVIAPNPALFRRTLGDQRRWPARLGHSYSRRITLWWEGEVLGPHPSGRCNTLLEWVSGRGLPKHRVDPYGFVSSLRSPSLAHSSPRSVACGFGYGGGGTARGDAAFWAAARWSSAARCGGAAGCGGAARRTARSSFMEERSTSSQ